MEFDYTKIWASAYQKMIHEPKNHGLDNHQYLAQCWTEAVLDYLQANGAIVIHRSELKKEEL